MLYAQWRVSQWSTADAAWLKAEVAKAGRQEDIAAAAGLSRPGLVAILNGNRKPKPQTFIDICDALGLDPTAPLPSEARLFAALSKLEPPTSRRDEFEQSSQPSASGKGRRQQAGAVLAIPEIDLAYGMGGTFVDDLSVSETMRELPTDWVRQFTRAPATALVLCKGIGDSMMPTLLDSDVLLVDRSQDTLKQSDRIWVVMVGDVGMVKRVRVQPNGNLLILSDNQNVPPMEAVDGEAVLIGRVVAIVRKM